MLKFFLNAREESYLRGLEDEFGESSNSIRIELNKFEKAGLLNSRSQGNKKLFRANTKHPLFPDIHNILLKHIGFDEIINRVVNNLGDIQEVYLTGKLAQGLNDEIIDIIFIGSQINKDYLSTLINKTEKLIQRSIRYQVFPKQDIEAYRKKQPENQLLLLYQQERLPWEKG